jgi:hypothetical protein
VGGFLAVGLAALFSLPESAALQHRLISELLSFAFMVPVEICFLVWLWSMGSFLNSIAPPSLKRGVGLFHLSLVYPLPYIFVFLTVITLSTSPWVALIIPFHLLAMFFLLYPLYFVSKSLAMIEKGRLATFYDYAGPFFLLWFFPVGIWFTQPRINRLYAGRKGASALVGQGS